MREKPSEHSASAVLERGRSLPSIGVTDALLDERLFIPAQAGIFTGR
jgi:hypothetical protein